MQMAGLGLVERLSSFLRSSVRRGYSCLKQCSRSSKIIIRKWSENSLRNKRRKEEGANKSWFRGGARGPRPPLFSPVSLKFCIIFIEFSEKWKKKKNYLCSWQVGKCPCHPFLNVVDPSLGEGERYSWLKYCQTFAWLGWQLGGILARFLIL